MNILDKIVAHKHIEIAEAKQRISIADLEKSDFFEKKTHSLSHHILYIIHQDKVGIIAEFKRKSPSKGIINDVVKPEIITKGYADAGAAGLSVLTDTEFFGGSFSDFAAARLANPTTPMLRKDFMVDEYQLFEAKAMGADVILLIAACLTPNQVKLMGKKAHELGLEVLLEVHDEQELETSLCEYVDLVGVNNRNLKTFVTSIETSVQLVEKIPNHLIKISESGLKDAQTIATLRKIGYQGFLIGEAFMKTNDPAEELRMLSSAVNGYKL